MANNNKSGNHFTRGVKDGIAIALGYLSVSFSFGVLAVSCGLTWWQAVIVSMANLTSAGQVAGIGIMSASGGLIEMAVSQLVINVRYSLMSISMSQKTDSSMNIFSRALLAFGITDEIFGVSMAADHEIGRNYLSGLILLPFAGWTSGTLLGAVLGSILPTRLTAALAIGIYGMFIAIVLPVTRKSKNIMTVVLIAILLSVLFRYVPFFSFLSGNFSSIVSAVIAALIGALILPIAPDKLNSDINIDTGTNTNTDTDNDTDTVKATHKEVM